jgi:signal transduction histidine kinase/CheY-like chemotaxis protein
MKQEMPEAESSIIRVLIVDDDVVIHGLFTKIFDAQGYELLCASSGQEALALAKAQQIHCCFIDHFMAGLDGIATMQALRTMDSTLPCFIMTGLAETQIGLQAMRAGAADFLTKPFDTKRVRDLVESHVRGVRSVSTQLVARARATNDVDLQRTLANADVHILVIDDEAEIRNLARRVLLNEGYQVDVLADGAMAIEAIHRKHYHLIMTDLKMPTLDGLALLREVKRVTPDTAYVIMTGYGSLETARVALQLGASDYLLKPLADIHELVRVTQRVVERQDLRRDHEALLGELKQKVFELDTLYEISQSISYTLDYNQLIDLILHSLYKVVPFDVAGSVLLRVTRPELMLVATRPHAPEVFAQAKDHVMAATAAACGDRFHSAEIVTTQTIMPGPDDTTPPACPPGRLQSFFNVPLVVDETLVGMIHVSAFKPHAFSTTDIRLLYTVAQQMAQAVGRIRRLIAQEQSKMHALVQSMPVGILMIDEEEHVVVVNPAAREMLRISSDEYLTPALIEAHLQNLGIDGVKMRSRSVVQGMVEIDVEVSQPPRVLAVRQDRVTDERGACLGLMTSIQDVTAQKKLSQMKDEFISVVSHELRTPLTIVKTAIENLDDGLVGPLTAPQSNIVSMSKRGTVRLARLIDDLLDLSRLESGNGEMQCGCIEPVDFIREIMQGFATTAQGQGLVLRCDVAPETPCIYADPHMMMQVCNNLLSNALHYAKSEVCVTVKACAGEVQLSVIDDGEGIAPTDHAKLFSKFQQIHRPSGGAGYKGTGLGLAICQEIVTQHGGKIWVESDLHQGAKFHVTLAQYSDAIAGLERSGARIAKRQRPVRRSTARRKGKEGKRHGKRTEKNSHH